MAGCWESAGNTGAISEKSTQKLFTTSVREHQIPFSYLYHLLWIETVFYTRVIISHNMRQNLKIVAAPTEQWAGPGQARRPESRVPVFKKVICSLRYKDCLFFFFKLIVVLPWECVWTPMSQCVLCSHSSCVCRWRRRGLEEGVFYYITTWCIVRHAAQNLSPIPHGSYYTVTLPCSVLLH